MYLMDCYSKGSINRLIQANTSSITQPTRDRPGRRYSKVEYYYPEDKSLSIERVLPKSISYPVDRGLGSQVGIVFYICAFHLCDPMWAEFRFSRPRPDLRVFLRVLRLSFLSKIDSQSKTSGLGAVLRDHA